MRRGRSCVLLEEEHLLEANEEVLLNRVMTRNNYTSDGIYTYGYIGYIFIILSFYYISEVAISVGTREPSIHLDHMNLYPHIYIYQLFDTTVLTNILAPLIRDTAYIYIYIYLWTRLNFLLLMAPFFASSLRHFYSNFIKETQTHGAIGMPHTYPCDQPRESGMWGSAGHRLSLSVPSVFRSLIRTRGSVFRVIDKSYALLGQVPLYQGWCSFC